MIRFLLYLFGVYEIEISGSNMERFINICANQRIVLWNLTPTNQGYAFQIRYDVYKDVSNLSKKTNTKIRIIGRRGLPFFFERNKKRKAFFLGGFLCLVLLLGLSQFLWNITVSGTEKYTKREILNYVKEQRYRIGTYKKQIDCDKLEEKLREKYHQIAWVSCSLTGTRLHIEIKESLDKNTKQNTKKPCDIVSNKAGKIIFLSVKSGTPLVKVGSKVKEGDTLISGLIYYYSDDYQVTQTDRMKADGRIILRTKIKYYEALPISFYKKIYEKKKKSIQKLQIGTINIKFPIKKVSKYTDITYVEHKAHLWSDFYLPVSVTIQIKRKYKPAQVTLTKEQGIRLLEQRKKAYRKKLREKGIKIIKDMVTYQRKQNDFIAKGEFIVEEPVGKIRNIHPLSKEQEEYITPTTATP